MRVPQTIINIILTGALVVSCAGGEKRPGDEARQRAFELTRQAFDEHWEKDWEKVVELATGAIEADPGYVHAYSMRGAAYNRLSRPGMAVPDLERAIGLEPGFKPAWINRGMAYLMLERFDMAKDDFAHALELDPDDITANVHMAEILTKEDNVLLACQYLQKAMAMGFNDMRMLEEGPNFKGLMYSDCYDDLRMEELEKREFQKRAR